MNHNQQKIDTDGEAENRNHEIINMPVHASSEQYEKKFNKILTQQKLKLDENGIVSFSQLNDNQLMKIFDFLMPDWRAADEVKKSYDLLAKNDAIKKHSGLNIWKQVKELMEKESKSIFHPFAFEILCQFISEWILANSLNGNKSVLGDSADMINDLESFDKPFQHLTSLIIAYCSFSIENHATMMEHSELIKLLYFLRRGYFAQFEMNFMKILNENERKYGNFGKVELEPFVKFFFFIAQSLGFRSFITLFIRHFPHLERCSHLHQSFRSRTSVYYSRIVMKLDENVEKSRKQLNKLLLKQNMSKCMNAMLGRNTIADMSVFEQVLSTKGMGSDQNYIQKICDKLQISESPELLLNVSTF